MSTSFDRRDDHHGHHHSQPEHHHRRDCVSLELLHSALYNLDRLDQVDLPLDQRYIHRPSRSVPTPRFSSSTRACVCKTCGLTSVMVLGAGGTGTLESILEGLSWVAEVGIPTSSKSHFVCSADRPQFVCSHSYAFF